MKAGKCSCDDGKYEASTAPTKCQDCHSNCLTCTDSGESDCQTCDDSSFARDGSCKCDSSAVMSAGECVCPASASLVSSLPTKCGDSSCHENCKTCNGQSIDKCTSCEDSATLENGICSCDSSALMGAGTCSCKDGDYKSSTTPVKCTACHDNCKTCTGGEETDCTSCDSSATLSEGKCSCDSSATLSDGKCVCAVSRT